MNISDLKESINTHIRIKINDLFINCETATHDDIRKAYIAGAKMVFNEMVQTSVHLPEQLAEKMLTIFNEVLEEYK